MSGTRTLRDRLADIEAHGLAIASIKFGRHVKVDLVAPDGRAMMLILSKTPSDRRAAAKVRSQLRRFARQEATP
jgi:hypothetical protein